ncbi:MAG: hypothetical protein EBR82_60980 [Caulobacteraceae bacterium]|nr:hypothetical protein [Caulobacteraceae bacterium]
MPLSDALLAASLQGTPLIIEIGLAADGLEVQAPEYQRQRIDQWQVDGSIAVAAARFGPFADGVFADSLMFYANGELVDQEQFAERMRVLPGASFEHITELRLTRPKGKRS